MEHVTANSKKITPAIEELFSIVTNEAVENSFGFALWSMPGETTKHLILSKFSERLTEVSLEDAAPGFLFSPFEKNKPPVYMEATYRFTFDQTLKEPVDEMGRKSMEWLTEQLTNKSRKGSRVFSSAHASIGQPADIVGYKEIVERAISEIRKGSFEKIVLARFRDIPLDNHFDVFDSFLNLCSIYTNAFVSLVSLPEHGTWLGASPELLVRVTGKTQFETEALAGTQPFLDGTDLRQVAWTQKEIEEQALVSRYIINCFKKIRLREYEEHGPRTIAAGNLMHLKTSYAVDMTAVNFPQLGSVMLSLLHPTSAVCGMPLEPALAFIATHEGFDRRFYAGYLGPVAIDDQTTIFVNLRCMELLENRARIYAGAGITIDSDPEKEWRETEMKMNTLLRTM